MGVGDWKKHGSPPTAPQQLEQNVCYGIKNNSLTSYKYEGHNGINNAMLCFEPVQPVP
jgi:hypothetical protein